MEDTTTNTTTTTTTTTTPQQQQQLTPRRQPSNEPQTMNPFVNDDLFKTLTNRTVALTTPTQGLVGAISHVRALSNKFAEVSGGGNGGGGGGSRSSSNNSSSRSSSSTRIPSVRLNFNKNFWLNSMAGI